MDEDVKEKTRKTAALYFNGVAGEKPFELWKAFDNDLAKELSLFITGRMYAREKLPHQVRQLVTIAVLTALGHQEELRLHIEAALNVGCTPGMITETVFQTFTYAGIPTVNAALKTLREVLIQKDLWPPENE